MSHNPLGPKSLQPGIIREPASSAQGDLELLRECKMMLVGLPFGFKTADRLQLLKRLDAAIQRKERGE